MPALLPHSVLRLLCSTALPGPAAGPRPAWLVGNLAEMLSKGQVEAAARWGQLYGPIWCFWSVVGFRIAWLRIRAYSSLAKKAIVCRPEWSVCCHMLQAGCSPRCDDGRPAHRQVRRTCCCLTVQLPLHCSGHSVDVQHIV